MTDVHETEDVFRLYREEWVIVETVSGTGDRAQPFVELAYRFITDTYEGRVPEHRFRVMANTDKAGHFWVHVTMLRPNMKGEFKYAHLAQRHAEKKGYAHYEVVSRNSRRDHELRAYGVRKMS